MSLLNDCYISYLNLDSRLDRREHIEKELFRVGIDATRTRGKLPHEFNLNDPKLKVQVNRTPGSIGCHYGQVEIMQKALDLNKHAFVLEDDTHFCEDFLDRIKEIERFMDTHDNWAVWWLGGTCHNPAWWHTENHNSELQQCKCTLGRDMDLTDNPRVIRTYAAFSTFAYIVNKKHLQYILDFLEENIHLSMGIDWETFLFQPYLETYMYLPGCCRQINNQSNIGKGETIFSSFAALNGSYENSAYWFQERKEDFNPEIFDWGNLKKVVS